jgi:DNA-binding CsgD family transcriptional regulator
VNRQDGTPVRTPIGVLAARSLTALRDGDITAATAAADAGRALADARSQPRDPAGLAELGWAESWLERFPEAETHLRAAVAAARHTGRADLLPGMLVALAHVSCWTGRLPAAVGLARNARRHGDAPVRAAAAALESMAVLWMGGPGSGTRSLELARSAVDVAGLDGWWGRITLASLGQARLFADDAAGCTRLVLAAGRDAELSGLPASLRPMWFSLLCGAALRCGDVEAADGWAQRAEALRRHVGLRGQQSFAALATGQVLARRGKPVAAAELLRAAATGFRQSGMLVMQSVALVAGAQATAAGGHPLSAAEMLRRAHRTAVWCGAQRVAEMAVRGLGALPAVRPVPATRVRTAPPPAAPEAPGSLAELTGREREIATLAATGVKTRTIARRLGVSPRTVDAHLSRIYRKLGVPGRAGLVAVVTRADALPDGAS